MTGPGRPRLYEPDGPEADAFLEKVADGVRLKRALQDVGLVWGIVSRWIANDDKGFAARYARARVASGGHWEDKATEAVETATPANAQVARIQDDHYRWRAKVSDPKRYGEKMDVTSQGKAIVTGVVVLPAPEKEAG